MENDRRQDIPIIYKMKFRKIIQRLVCKCVFKQAYKEYISSHQFFSQNGEDIILDDDCEEHDLNILKSNNWVKFRPTLILAENNDCLSKKIEEFLAIKNYSLLLS